ncbi:hypothetical protein JB92DRAFT_2848164 [Gautieria morchelliformis]|nr:hypothetical protein JB92DRAFT_2848164 [Gautieria morchelliformis]
MMLQCSSRPVAEVQACLVRGCCSINGIMDIAITNLCEVDDDFEQALNQYKINRQIALCHFDGHSVDSVQLLLTPNASALLDSMNRPDEQLRQQQVIYRALQILGGHVGLPILLIFSIFSKKAQRDPTFINFCFTWIFSSITFSVGLYRLGPASQFFGATLPFIHSGQECLNQAALVSGSQPMTDTAMCALIVQLWFDIRAAIHGPHSPRQIRWTRATLLAAPYVSLLAFSLPALSATTSDIASGRVIAVAVQTNFYCLLIDEKITSRSSSQGPFLISQYTVLLSILIVTLIFDACIIHILYRRWRFFQRTGEKALQIPLSVAFRVIIFCAYRLVVAVAYVATMLQTQGISVLGGPNEASFIPVWVDMLQAGTPLVAFLIFGTSKEFLDALMFWRWFNPTLATAMCCHRSSPVTRSASNAQGEVFDGESVVSGDSVLVITQETKNTNECLPR